MDVRTDYETEDIIAVFDDPEVARRAARRVRVALGDPRKVSVVPLPPGRYQLADNRLQEVLQGAVRSARLSVPLGALAGLGLAAVALPGVGPVAIAGLAAAGAVGGLVVGSMIGAINRTRWDPDPAPFIDVGPDSRRMAVIVQASPALGRRETTRAIRHLARGGAIAFLDPTTFHQMAHAVGLTPA
jgi:hypothetical protein